MELSHLQTFLLLAKNGSFSQTAALLHLTQPAVSQQIKSLEEELGQILFARRSRSTRLTKLTPAGKLFLPYARQITASLGESKKMLKESEQKKSLSFAAGSTTITYHLPELLHAYKRRAPEFELIIKAGSSQAVTELVLSGVVDFGFVTIPVAPNGNLKSIPLFREQILLIAPADWNPPVLPLRLQDLENEEMILPSPPGDYRDLLDLNFRRYRFYPRIVFELDNIEGIKQMVRIGLGVSFLPESIFYSGLYSGTLKPCPLVEPDNFFCTTFLISLPEKFWTRAMKEFARLLAEKYALPSLIENTHAKNIEMPDTAGKTDKTGQPRPAGKKRSKGFSLALLRDSTSRVHARD